MADRASAPRLSVVVPTFNERANVAVLVEQLLDELPADDVQILFIDDSRDDTPQELARLAVAYPSVDYVHRASALGGLSGAVVHGLRLAAADTVVVMDGDLQHPPTVIPRMLEVLDDPDVDLVVASRYAGAGSATGLASGTRLAVSQLSTAASKLVLGRRLRHVSDPMTGFFALDRRRVDISRLHPSGFKILLEILLRSASPLRVREVPFTFRERHAGRSKATMRQGALFLAQLMRLRLSVFTAFTAVGAAGAVVNVLIVAALTALGVDTVAAAVIAAEVTIIGNFVLLERLVFARMSGKVHGLRSRFVRSFAYNNIDTAVRVPLIAVMVTWWSIPAAVATAATLLVAFFARWFFHARVVYRTRAERHLRPVAVAEDRTDDGSDVSRAA